MTMVVHRLANGNISQYEIIRDLPAVLCFEWLEIELIKNDLQEKMNHGTG